MSLSNAPNKRDLLSFYHDHLQRMLLPFWKRSVDPHHGGVYTCYNNSGSALVSRDKYTWSQGRFIWLWSKIANMSKTGMLKVDPNPYLDQARKTVEFLEKHAILPNKNCAYLLSEDGEWKEAIPGAGHDISFYADCFVILGFTSYAKASGERNVLTQALQMYDHVVARVREGIIRTEPYPIPKGMKSHAVSMICLNVTQELYDTLLQCEHPRSEEFALFLRIYAEEILQEFMQSDGRVIEIVPRESHDTDTMLYRHLNPGHTIESMWFLIRASTQLHHREWLPPAIKAIRKAYELGWDQQHGGLFRFVDRDGGSPRGRRIGGRYEQLILETWDMKLWWPHAEALYATLLGYQITQAEDMLKLYNLTHEYTFRTFPNPDMSVGEWIQIRDRAGIPMDAVVALPVKDPFHILRSVLLIIELLSNQGEFV